MAEIATQQGFWPDMLGTDLHTGNYEGPAYDMPTVMSKFLYLGRVFLLLTLLYFFVSVAAIIIVVNKYKTYIIMFICKWIVISSNRTELI